MAKTSASENSQSLLEKISQSLENLVELRIVTEVGDAKMESQINILSGDITTKIDQRFVDGDLADLREFHAQREAKGYEVISANLRALREMADLFVHLEQQQS